MVPNVLTGVCIYIISVDLSKFNENDEMLGIQSEPELPHSWDQIRRALAAGLGNSESQNAV